MSNDQKRNRMEDSEDAGLKAIMGARFHDMSQGERKTEAEPALFRQPSRAATFPGGEGPGSRKNVEAPVYTPNGFDKLKACAKGAGLYGGISMLLFWWQQAGLLDPRAAVPSFVVLALLAGLQIGRVCNG